MSGVERWGLILGRETSGIGLGWANRRGLRIAGADYTRNAYLTNVLSRSHPVSPALSGALTCNSVDANCPCLTAARVGTPFASRRELLDKLSSSIQIPQLKAHDVRSWPALAATPFALPVAGVTDGAPPFRGPAARAVGPWGRRGLPSAAVLRRGPHASAPSDATRNATWSENELELTNVENVNLQNVVQPCTQQLLRNQSLRLIFQAGMWLTAVLHTDWSINKATMKTQYLNKEPRFDAQSRTPNIQKQAALPNCVNTIRPPRCHNEYTREPQRAHTNLRGELVRNSRSARGGPAARPRRARGRPAAGPRRARGPR